MPRRTRPDPLALEVGQRVRQLRQEAGMTLEGLAFAANVSKGHLSSTERGLVMPTVATLRTLAAALGLLVADLVNDPERDDRSRLLDRSRSLPKGALRKLVRELGTGEKATERRSPR
jgi:transcriptional regulator with XRE-family HTH domain